MNTETKKHAKFSASGSERWMNCPGSIALSEKAPPQFESEYAKEGTDAHSCVEAFLKDKDHPLTVRAALKKKYPADMVKHAETTRNLIMGRMTVDAILHCETKVKLPVSEPDQFGTVDAAIVEPFGKLTVIDFKYGAGIPVYPKDNSQLIYYALGLAHQYDYNFTEVELMIIQPRAETDEGPVRSHVMEIDELLAWRENFEAGIVAAKDPLSGFKSGKWCRFCPASTLCPEISTNALQEAQIDFDEVVTTGQVPMPETARDLTTLLKAADRLDFWVSELRAYAFNTLKAGGAVPGYKLVEKRAIRKWTEPIKAAKLAKNLFGSRAFITELLSPAQLEKLPGAKEWVATQTSAVSSGLTMAEEDDKRPAVNPLADFDVIEDKSSMEGKESTTQIQKPKQDNFSKQLKTTKRKK